MDFTLQLCPTSVSRLHCTRAWLDDKPTTGLLLVLITDPETLSLSVVSFKMEGYDAKFDPPLDKRLECPICLLAQREPMQTPCGHRFCSACILRALRLEPQLHACALIHVHCLCHCVIKFVSVAMLVNN